MSQEDMYMYFFFFGEKLIYYFFVKILFLNFWRVDPS